MPWLALQNERIYLPEALNVGHAATVDSVSQQDETRRSHLLTLGVDDTPPIPTIIHSVPQDSPTRLGATGALCSTPCHADMDAWSHQASMVGCSFLSWTQDTHQPWREQGEEVA